MEDVSNYEKLRADAERYYRSIGPRYSPALGQYVQFPSEGFNHVVFKRARSERERSSQILRFKLLPLAAKLVELSTTYQEDARTAQAGV